MNEAIKRLEPLVGEWGIEARFPGAGGPPPADLGARSTFEWTLDGAFLLQRSEVPVPEAPDGLMVYTPDGDGYLQHYFDSRGVVRIYRMTFDDDGVWTLLREEPDFTPLGFKQRWTGRLSDDGDTIAGRWEKTGSDLSTWETDFELIYTRRR